MKLAKKHLTLWKCQILKVETVRERISGCFADRVVDFALSSWRQLWYTALNSVIFLPRIQHLRFLACFITVWNAGKGGSGTSPTKWGINLSLNMGMII